MARAPAAAHMPSTPVVSAAGPLQGQRQQRQQQGQQQHMRQQQLQQQQPQKQQQQQHQAKQQTQQLLHDQNHATGENSTKAKAIEDANSRQELDELIGDLRLVRAARKQFRLDVQRAQNDTA